MDSLLQNDKEVYDIIQNEFQRQKNGLELIASENFVSQPVLDALGSVMTNKYSEGQPGKRYYGGNEHIDDHTQVLQQTSQFLLVFLIHTIELWV